MTGNYSRKYNFNSMEYEIISFQEQTLSDCCPLCLMAAELRLQDELYAINGMTHTKLDINKLRLHHKTIFASKTYNSRLAYVSNLNQSANFHGFTEAEEADIEEIVPGPPKTPKKRKSDGVDSSSPFIKKRKRIDLSHI